MVPHGIGRLLFQEPDHEGGCEAVLDPDVRDWDHVRQGHALPCSLLSLQVGRLYGCPGSRGRTW